MLIATIRKLETVTVEVAGEGLPEIQELLEQHRPEGFDLTKAPVAMLKGQTAIKAVGTYSKRDGLLEIEGVDLADVRTKVPDGWQILNVRGA